MPATCYPKRGEGLFIRYTMVQSWLGSLIVGSTTSGLCTIEVGETPKSLIQSMQQRFPKADFQQDDTSLKSWIDQILTTIDRPNILLKLPLEIQGTAFQQQVWKALQSIPCGETRSYRDIAERIQRPKAVRAVAQACAANPIAVVIPCHRVLRQDGSLSGYRWGLERKQQLLDRERQISVEQF